MSSTPCQALGKERWAPCSLQRLKTPTQSAGFQELRPNRYQFAAEQAFSRLGPPHRRNSFTPEALISLTVLSFP